MPEKNPDKKKTTSALNLNGFKYDEYKVNDTLAKLYPEKEKQRKVQYEEDRKKAESNYIAKQLLQTYPRGNMSRGEWIDSLPEEEKKAFIQSEYSDLPVKEMFSEENISKPSFEEWYKTVPEHKSDTANYDLEAAYKNLPYNEMKAFATSDAHLPDTYKKPTHPTFSNESVYSTEEKPGGTWTKDEDDNWTFTPSWVNIENAGGEDKLKEYFDKYEKDVTLDLSNINNGNPAKKNKIVVFAEAYPHVTSMYNFNSSPESLPDNLKELQKRYFQIEDEIKAVENKKDMKEGLRNLRNTDVETFHEVSSLYDKLRADGYKLPNIFKMDESELEKFKPPPFAAYSEEGKALVDFYNKAEKYKAIESERRRINSKYSEELANLYNEENRVFDEFYTDKANVKVASRGNIFEREGNLISRMYENDSTVDVEVIPFYDEAELAENKLSELSENDKVVILGHAGSKLGGIPNAQWADMLSKSKAKECYLGSCEFSGFIQDYEDFKGGNVYYRPKGHWAGVNVNAKTLVEALYSRVEDNYAEGTSITKEPEIGSEYDIYKGN